MKMDKLFAVMLSFMLLLCAHAQAETSIDTQRDVGLSIVFRDDGIGLPDARFKAYHVAKADNTGRMTLVSPFSRYNVDIGDASESAMAGAASTLEGYILRDQLAPLYKSSTDASGKTRLFGDNGMKPGLYLVAAERFVYNGKAYTIQPSLVQLPVWDAVNERWNYDVVISAKYDTAPDSPDFQTITRKVLKVWEQNGHTAPLPAEVVVHLLQDGRVFDTVRLNAGNLWRHTWPDLEANHHWTVVEDAVKDYNVVVTREGITFVVTNSYDPDDPEVPGPTPAPTPTVPPVNPPDSPKLPQTGQLWWPVAMLVSAGLLLIVIGLVRRRGN